MRIATLPSLALALVFGLVPAAGCSPERRPVAVLSEEGARLGSLSRLDAFPLYELRYEAPYRAEDFLEELPGTAASPAPPLDGIACTCFAAIDGSGHRVMGRNFDWDRHPVLLLRTSPPGAYASLSLVDLHYLGYGANRSPLDHPAALAAAPRLPFDGVNEKGLAVGMMAVGHAEGIASKGLGTGAAPRRRAGELVLIRLLLDKAASVEEAIALARSFDVDFDPVPVHYFVADGSGASAVIEYLDGEAVVLESEAAWQVSTNFIFAEVPPGLRDSSCRRFASASSSLSGSGGRLGPKGPFALLEEVSQPTTIWSSAYDLNDPSLELALGGDFAHRFRFNLTGRKR